MNKKKTHRLGENICKCYNLQEINFQNLQTASVQFSSVQFSRSVVSDSAIPRIAAHQASLSITISQSSLKLKSIESVMPSSHLNLCRPLFLLPLIPPSLRVFSSESALYMTWPKYWNFSFHSFWSYFSTDLQ